MGVDGLAETPDSAMPVLPGKEYYRASKLGEGSYGSVVTVYDDDGCEYAAKMFDSDDSSEDETDDSEEDWTPTSSSGVDVGALREISMLRFINGAHPNLMRLFDVTMMGGSLCMIMPKAKGSLSDAIEKQSLGGSQKLNVATLLLHAVAFLARQGVMHRDIKPDNVLLDESDQPCLTDFSLCKHMEPADAAPATDKAVDGSRQPLRKRARGDKAATAVALHTTGQGTPTYTAPEVVQGGSYDLKADVWSLGVVLYELFNGALLEHVKDKRAFAYLEEVSGKLSDKRPVPATMKRMLQLEPQRRATAAEALELIRPAGKVNLPETGPVLDMAAVDPGGCEASTSTTQRKRGKAGRAPHAGADDDDLAPAHACSLLGFANATTARAAESYWRRSAAARELGPIGAACCSLLASKIYEVEVYSPDRLVDLHSSLAEYEAEEYAEVEGQLLQDLGYCLCAP